MMYACHHQRITIIAHSCRLFRFHMLSTDAGPLRSVLCRFTSSDLLVGFYELCWTMQLDR